MTDENEQLLGTLTSNEINCLPEAKLVGPMNASVFVTFRGASETYRNGMGVDRHDKLFQYHTLPGMHVCVCVCLYVWVMLRVCFYFYSICISVVVLL